MAVPKDRGRSPDGSPRGRAAIRALVEESIEERLAQASGRLDRAAMRRSRREEHVDYWPAATEAVEAATGLDEYDAAARVGRVVNQLAELVDQERDLFAGEVRERAIEESLDYLLTGAAATTGEVQARAEAVWSLHEQISELMRRQMAATEELRQAWRDWAGRS